MRGPSTLGNYFKYNDVHSAAGLRTLGFFPDETNITGNPLLYDVDSGLGPLEWDLDYPEWSPCFDQGDSGMAYLDPDGSVNNMGIYGGPEGIWPSE